MQLNIFTNRVGDLQRTLTLLLSLIMKLQISIDGLGQFLQRASYLINLTVIHTPQGVVVCVQKLIT